MSGDIRDDRPVRLTVPEIRALRQAAYSADRAELGPRQSQALDTAVTALEAVLSAETRPPRENP